MTTGVHSGKYAVVNGVDTVREWTVTDDLTLQRYVASNTLIGSGRTRGVRSWQGSFRQFGGRPVLMPNDVFEFAGYTAPDDVSLGFPGLVYKGSARVAQVAISWNWEAGEILGIETQFHGHLQLATETDALFDSTIPEPPPVHGTKIDCDTIEIPNCTNATLTLLADLPSYVNSSTFIGQDIWTGRRNGPLDWNLAVTVQDNRQSQLPAVGAISELRAYIDSTDFWRLKWGQRRGTSLTANRETGAIITQTLNWEMAGFKNGDVGEITLPGEAEPWWPVSGS